MIILINEVKNEVNKNGLNSPVLWLLLQYLNLVHNSPQDQPIKEAVNSENYVKHYPVTHSPSPEADSFDDKEKKKQSSKADSNVENIGAGQKPPDNNIT